MKKIILTMALILSLSFVSLCNVSAVGGNKSTSVNVGVATCKVSETAYYASTSPYWTVTGLSVTVSSQTIAPVSKTVSGSYATRTKSTLKRNYTVKYVDVNYNPHSGTGSITWTK